MATCAAQQQLDEDLESEAGDAGTLQMNEAARKEYMAIQDKAGTATGRMRQELTALQASLQVCLARQQCKSFCLRVRGPGASNSLAPRNPSGSRFHIAAVIHFLCLNHALAAAGSIDIFSRKPGLCRSMQSTCKWTGIWICCAALCKADLEMCIGYALHECLLRHASVCAMLMLSAQKPGRSNSCLTACPGSSWNNLCEKSF